MGLFVSSGRLLFDAIRSALRGCCCACIQKRRRYYVRCDGSSCDWVPLGDASDVIPCERDESWEYVDPLSICEAYVYGPQSFSNPTDCPEPDPSILPRVSIGGACLPSPLDLCCNAGCKQWVGIYSKKCLQNGACEWRPDDGYPAVIPCTTTSPSDYVQELDEYRVKLWGPKHAGDAPPVHDLNLSMLPSIDCGAICECRQWQRAYVLECSSTSAATWRASGAGVITTCHPSREGSFHVDGCQATLYGFRHWKRRDEADPANDLNTSLVTTPSSATIESCCSGVVMRQKKVTQEWNCSTGRWTTVLVESVPCGNIVGWTDNTSTRPCTSVGYGACANEALGLPDPPVHLNAPASCCNCDAPSSWSGTCLNYSDGMVRQLGAGLSGMSVYGVFMDDNYSDNNGSFSVSAYEAVCINGSWTLGALLGSSSVSGADGSFARICGLGSIGSSGKTIMIVATGTIKWRDAFIPAGTMTSCPALYSNPSGPISLPAVGPCAATEPWMSCGRAWRLVLKIAP